MAVEMNDICALGALDYEQEAVIRAIVAKGAMRRRLMDIGITPGGRIRRLFRGPGGEPTAYLVNDTVIALRRGDADTVIVAPI